LSQFAVVICAHDSRRWAHLQAAVGSVQRQTLPPYEIVVVVDGDDQLYGRAAAELEGVHVVKNQDQPGLGGARNSGISASTAPLVAFLDDDALATERWLELLSAAYVDPDVAGVGGAIEPRWERGRPAWFPPEFDWVVGCTYRGMPERTAEVRNLIGCNVSYRRDVLEALNGFRLDTTATKRSCVSGSASGGRTRSWSTFRTRLPRTTSRHRERRSRDSSRAVFRRRLEGGGRPPRRTRPRTRLGTRLYAPHPPTRSLGRGERVHPGR
jgi:glycosyltransferase involved in cell wall biosynthesis